MSMTLILWKAPVVGNPDEAKAILYDPQGPDIFLPTDPIDPGPVPPPTAFEWFKGFGIAAVLCALTYAAWLIPIGWLRWPAVVVAGAMIAGLLGFIDLNQGRTCADDTPPL